MGRNKIQLLAADFAYIPDPNDDMMGVVPGLCRHLHVNRKSIQFANAGGIDSFGEIPTDTICTTTPNNATRTINASNCYFTPSIRTAKLPGSGLSTCSCEPPRASKGVESSLYSSVPPVNQWLKDYQANIKESYRRTE